MGLTELQNDLDREISNLEDELREISQNINEQKIKWNTLQPVIGSLKDLRAQHS